MSAPRVERVGELLCDEDGRLVITGWHINTGGAPVLELDAEFKIVRIGGFTIKELFRISVEEDRRKVGED